MCRWCGGRLSVDSVLPLAPAYLMELIQGIICLIIAKDTVFLMGLLRARALLAGSKHSMVQSQLFTWAKLDPSALGSSTYSVSQMPYVQDPEQNML